MCCSMRTTCNDKGYQHTVQSLWSCSAAGQGPASNRASEVPLPMDSQASVQQASQGMTGPDDTTTRITLVPADRWDLLP